MNIFILDLDPVTAAQQHCDKHVVKMCIEYAQILSTSARVMGYQHDGYRSTHVGHPCTVWAGKSIDNWSWIYHLAIALGDEFSYRYGGLHKSTMALDMIPAELRNAALSEIAPAPILAPQAMPDYCKDPDVVKAYRNYYVAEKRNIATWKRRQPPVWWADTNH